MYVLQARQEQSCIIRQYTRHVGSRECACASACACLRVCTCVCLCVVQGHAVRRGMLCARGEFCLMMDADGATRVSDLELLEAALAK